jgi:hypothetical protein
MIRSCEGYIKIVLEALTAIYGRNEYELYFEAYQATPELKKHLRKLDIQLLAKQKDNMDPYLLTWTANHAIA